MSGAHSQAPEIPARYYALLCDLLGELGMDVASLLRSARIRAGELERPDGMLSLRQVEALVRHAVARDPRPDLGFEFGRHIKLSAHDILGYAFLTSATVGEACALAATYRRLISPLFMFTYREDAGHAELSRDPIVTLDPVCLEFHLEWAISGIHTQLKSLLGPALRSFDIHVSGYEPRHTRYRELAPARVHFEPTGAPVVRVVLDRAQAQSRPPLADRRTLANATARCAERLAQMEREAGLGRWVRMMLSQASGRMPTLHELARILHIGVHTLERRLREEGVRFRELSAEVRHERACVLLERGAQPVTQIAYELGYGDPANFSRAFRERAGATPSEYRERAARALAKSAAAAPARSAPQAA